MSLSERVKAAICGATEAMPIPETSVEQIRTPFIDGDGAQVHLYATGDVLTDGGAVINNLRSMRALDEYDAWPFRESFLLRYGMEQTDAGELRALSAREPDTILRFAQGVARLPSLFEVKPISEAARFPVIVAQEIDGYLERHVPSGAKPSKFVASLKKKKIWNFKGVRFDTDYSPARADLMVQVVSHASSEAGTQRQHVQSKIMPFEFGRKTQKRLSLALLVPRLGAYRPDMRRLMRAETDEIYEWEKENHRDEFAKLLAALPNRRTL